MPKKTGAAAYTSTLLRLPQPLLDQVRELAGRDRRSLNSELLCAIEEYVERRTVPPAHRSQLKGLPK